MAEVTLFVCDVCDRPGAVRYHVLTEEDEWDIDLCAKCSMKLRGDRGSRKSTPKVGNRFHVTQLPPQDAPSGAVEGP